MKRYIVYNIQHRTQCIEKQMQYKLITRKFNNRFCSMSEWCMDWIRKRLKKTQANHTAVV